MLKKEILIGLLCLTLTGCTPLLVGISCLESKHEHPSIKKGSFPFELHYRIGEESYKINDVINCSYEGTTCSTGGRHDDWRVTLQGGGDTLDGYEVRILLLEHDTGVNIYGLFPGCRTLMGRDSNNIENVKNKLNRAWGDIPNDPIRGHFVINPDELKEKYDMEIQLKIAEPIKYKN